MSDRQIVCVARSTFYVAAAEGRFVEGVVHRGQLLLDADPIVQATGAKWAPVGTADEATARLITDIGPMAKLSDLLPRLGPLPADTEEAAELDEAPVRRRGRPKGTRSIPRDQIHAPDAIKNVKIPTACLGVGVPYIQLADALRLRGAKFEWVRGDA